MCVLSPWLIAGLAVAALLTVILIAAGVTSAVERVGLAKHLGYDPKSGAPRVGATRDDVRR